MKTFSKIISLVICWQAVCLPSRVSAIVSTQDALFWVRATWNVYDLSDDALTSTLDVQDLNSSSEATYRDWIDFFINAPPILKQVANRQYSQAAQEAVSYVEKYAEGQIIDQLISEADLDAVAAPAELGVLPLQIGLDIFQAALVQDEFTYEVNLYFQARNAGNSATAILNLAPYDLLQNVLITKSDGGWLWSEQGLPPNGLPGMTPTQFYNYAENLYLTGQAYSTGFNAAMQQIGADFQSDATASTPTGPTITFGPTSVTVSVGDTATFTVTASGKGPLYYQWQRNSVDISGATLRQYITSAAQASDNGDQYRVRVTNAQGSQTSGAATLMVNGAAPAGLTITTVSPPTLTGLPLPQTQLLHIYGSGFTSSSRLLFNGSIASDPTRLYFISANEIDYYIRTDTNAANWTVQVINGSQQSNHGTFTVVAPPPPSTGSLTVTLQPAGAVSAGAQWQGDGGVYHCAGIAFGIHQWRGGWKRHRNIRRYRAEHLHFDAQQRGRYGVCRAFSLRQLEWQRLRLYRGLACSTGRKRESRLPFRWLGRRFERYGQSGHHHDERQQEHHR